MGQWKKDVVEEEVFNKFVLCDLGQIFQILCFSVFLFQKGVTFIV